MIDTRDQIVVHYAAQAKSSSSRWSRVELVVIAYSKAQRTLVEAKILEQNRYYRSGPKTICGMREKKDNVKAAVAFAKRCLSDPLGVLPIDKIQDTYQRDSVVTQLAKVKNEVEVNGSISNIPSWDIVANQVNSGTLPISLALGQALVATVTATTTLSSDVDKTLRYYLMNAPLVLGHWGPFKRLFKLLESRNDVRDHFAITLARIDSTQKFSQERAITIENLSFLSAFLPDPVASHQTMTYLARRGRRGLRALSRANAEKYVRWATSFIVAADRLGDHSRIANRRILTDILYGRGAYDSIHGRGAIELPDQSVRYRRRWDRAPRTWDKHLNLVRSIWSKSASISDVQIWAFNVLKSKRADIPRLTKGGLNLAMISPYTPVRRTACAQISNEPHRFLQLDMSAAVGFLEFCSEKQFRTLFPTLEEHSSKRIIRESAFNFISDHGLQSVIQGETPAEVSPRAQKLLGYAFRHLRDRMSDVEVLNLGLYTGETNGFKPASLWRNALASLPLKTLIELRLQLPALSSAAKNVIDQACQTAARHDTDERLAVALAQSPSAKLRQLAWEILASGDVAQQTIGDVWESLIDHSSTAGGTVRLRQCIYDQRRLATLLDHPDVSPLLGRIAVALTANHFAGSKKALFHLASKNDSETILVTLDQIAQQYPLWQWAEERVVLRKLIVNVKNTRQCLWQGLADGKFELLIDRIKEASSVFKTLLDIIDPAEIIKITPIQARVLSELLSENPLYLIRNRDLSIATATCPSSEVATISIAILEARDKIKGIYMPLLESRFPVAMEAAQRYMRQVKDRRKLTQLIIAVCDSGIREARAEGLKMLEERREEYDPVAIYSALAEHKSPEISAEVARYVLQVGKINPKALTDFDQRVLRTRRHGRKAKDLVKERLGLRRGIDVITFSVSPAAEGARIKSLLALARGRSQRDREWALQELAQLTENGVNIPSFTVSTTS